MKGVWRARDRVFRPWKNGGGESAEIAVSPPGAGFDDFDWRISTAVVAADGPFSVFPGVDRILTVIAGGALVLTIDGAEHRIDADSGPFAFSGDLACSARCDGGPVLDLNVMVRRPLAARVTRAPVAARAGARRLAFLLADSDALARGDLVDLDRAEPDLVAALTGLRALHLSIG